MTFSAFCALSNELFTISLTKSKAISVLSVTELFKTLFKINLIISFASAVVFYGLKQLRIAFFCVFFDTVSFHWPCDTIFIQ